MSEDVKRTGSWKSIVAIIGAIAGLIAAAMPGVIQMMDQTAEKARQEALKSSQDAKKSQEMADLSYELLKGKISLLENEIDSLQNITQILVDEVRILSERRSANRRLSSTGRGGIGSPGLVSGSGGGVIRGSIETIVEPPEKAQDGVQKEENPLPVDLEQAWVKTKGE